jgi:hypothetical protein
VFYTFGVLNSTLSIFRGFRCALPSALVFYAFGVLNQTLSYFPRVALRFTLGFDVLRLWRIK